MNKFLSLFVILSFVGFSQENLRPVRLDTITEAWLSKDTESCFKQLLESYTSHPDSFILAYNLGYLSFLDGKLSQALSYFQDAKNLNSTYPFTNLMISKIYENSRNIVSAQNELQLGLKSNSDSYHLNLALARILNKTG